MHPAMLKLMKAKKKRPVDPNAPPRPNLLSHEKVLKDQKLTMAQMQEQILFLTNQVQEISSKLKYQTQYLSRIHSEIKEKR